MSVNFDDLTQTCYHFLIIQFARSVKVTSFPTQVISCPSLQYYVLTTIVVFCSAPKFNIE